MLPARRSSKSMTRSRRSHHALRATKTQSCPRCNQAKLPHRACANCGYVNPKVSLKVDSEEA